MALLPRAIRSRRGSRPFLQRDQNHAAQTMITFTLEVGPVPLHIPSFPGHCGPQPMAQAHQSAWRVLPANGDAQLRGRSCAALVCFPTIFRGPLLRTPLSLASIRGFTARDAALRGRC